MENQTEMKKLTILKCIDGYRIEIQLGSSTVDSDGCEIWYCIKVKWYELHEHI